MTAPIWITSAGNLGTLVENNAFIYGLQTTSSLAVTYYLVSGTLPPGITLEPSSGIISGTVPNLEQGATYYFTVRAINSDGIADRNFNIIVTDSPITWNIGENLGTILQNTFYSVLLSATDAGDKTLTYSLDSGNLPAGLVLEKNGLLSGYIGTIVPNTTTNVSFVFTIKVVGTQESTQTFTLTVTSLGNVTPQWNTIGAYLLSAQQGLAGGEVGNLQNGVPYSFQLKSVVPNPSSGLPITYSLVTGVLPPGITLSSAGLLSGTLSSQAVQVYPITVKIYDGVASATRVFYLRTNFVSEDLIYWLVDSSQIPVDLTTLTSGESETFLYNTNTYEITKSLYQTTYDQIILNKITNNYGLTLADTLFVVEASGGVYNVNSYLGNNVYNIFELDTISPQGGEFVFNLGNIAIGSKSALKVIATTLQFWVRYDLVSGTLPLGLYLDSSTGEIQGEVLDQSPGTYTFQIKAYNYTTSQNLTFSINVINNSQFGGNKLAVRLTDFAKIKWLQLNNIDLIPSEKIFRSSDENFGKKTPSEIVVLSDVDDSASTDTIFSLIKQQIATKLTPYNFITTPVTDDEGKVICDAVVLTWKDSFKGTLPTYVQPIEKNPLPNPTKTIYPGSLDAMRQFLINASVGLETFENWMNFYFTTDITNNKFILTGDVPGFIVGDKVVFANQIIPTPFENGITYYIIPITANEFRLADSLDNANAGSYLTFDINETEDKSGTIQYYFPGTPIAYLSTGSGSSVTAQFNSKINLTPFSYYKLSSGNQVIDTFFKTNYGHNMVSGDRIIFDEDFIPAPFIYNYVYYVIYLSDTTFSLASSYENALAGTPITFTNYTSDITDAPYTGAFKKVVSTQNGKIEVSEADIRFDMTVDFIALENHFMNKAFTASASTNIFTCQNHGLETSVPIEFKNQTLPPEFVNYVLYYAIVIDNNTFKLATTSDNAFSNVSIDVSTDFSGLIGVDDSTFIPLNTVSSFLCDATHTDSRFVSRQISKLDVGQIITLTHTTSSLPSPLAESTNYYVIPITNNSFRLATTLSNAQNNVFITFGNDFQCQINFGSNYSESNINQRQ